MATEPRLINAHINPLGFPQVDFGSRGMGPPTEADFLWFACALDVEADLGSILERYKELGHAEEPFISPVDEQFLGKVIWPLRHAKAAYSLGSHVATIALCGAVGEMIAELLFEMHQSKASVGGRELNEALQKPILGKTFENLTQFRKIEFLSALDIISLEQCARLHELRTIRNGYLHRYSSPLYNASSDAARCYELVTKIVVDAMGLKFGGHGGYDFDPAFLAYLSKRGTLSWALTPEEAIPADEDDTSDLVAE